MCKAVYRSGFHDKHTTARGGIPHIAVEHVTTSHCSLFSTDY